MVQLSGGSSRCGYQPVARSPSMTSSASRRLEPARRMPPPKAAALRTALMSRRTATGLRAPCGVSSTVPGSGQACQSRREAKRISSALTGGRQKVAPRKAQTTAQKHKTDRPRHRSLASIVRPSPAYSRCKCYFCKTRPVPWRSQIPTAPLRCSSAPKKMRWVPLAALTCKPPLPPAPAPA